MQPQIIHLATVTVMGVLQQAYFSMQVIYARRKYKVTPPNTSGCEDFERIYRAQANCSEYFPVFLAVLWVSGIFCHQGVAATCGLFYLYGRYLYFNGYSRSAQGRLAPMYFSATVLWILIGFSVVGILAYWAGAVGVLKQRSDW